MPATVEANGVLMLADLTPGDWILLPEGNVTQVFLIDKGFVGYLVGKSLEKVELSKVKRVHRQGYWVDDNGKKLA